MKGIITCLLLVVASHVSFAQDVHSTDDITIINGREITNEPVAKGIASYYHDKFVGRQTSTGEIFSNDKFTAASNSLKLNTYVKVTNLDNGKYLYVRINDRMNKKNPRLIDMASVCAKRLGYHYKGLAKVKVEIVPKEEGKQGILAQRNADISALEHTDNQL